VTDLQDRYRGTLLGLATGDAVGTTVEFSAPGTFAPVADLVGGGPFGLEPGQWTDDTSMALCLAASLIECRGFDARDQMERYLRWHRHGYLSSTGRCFDIGNTVRAALHGSLMRLAPVPLFYADDPAEAIRRAAASSRTTNGARTAVDACRYMAALIVGALRGASKEDLLKGPFAPAGWDWSSEPLARTLGWIGLPFAIRSNPWRIRCLHWHTRK
jgi:ADP-ribosylglycohydrolase